MVVRKRPATPMSESWAWNLYTAPMFSSCPFLTPSSIPVVSMVSTFKRSGSSNKAGGKSVCVHGNQWQQTMSAE